MEDLALVDNSPPKLKRRLRIAMARRIDGMGLPACAEASVRIRRSIQELPEVKGAGRLFLFACDNSEPDLLPLISDDGPWRTAFPLVAGPGRLQFYDVEDAARDFQRGAYDLREPGPDRGPEVLPEQGDVILAPGRAFAREDGGRLGRGGGFYDRFLAGAYGRATIVGVCFRCQVTDRLPMDSHDVPVSKIVTEAGVIEPLS